MPSMPFHILGLWFRGLFAVAIIAGGIYLLARWYDESHVVEPIKVVTRVEQPYDEKIRVERPRPSDPIPLPGVGLGRGQVQPRGTAAPTRRVFRFDPGLNRTTALLAGGIALLVWASLGRPIGAGISALPGILAGRGPGSKDAEPGPDRGGEIHLVRRRDGSEIHVECHGPAGAPPIVFTHGWGADATEWYYARKHLADSFRLILWDLPGLGRSRKPGNNDYSLEKLAADLETVLTFAGGRQVLLVGHSIGGMITLTFSRLFPEVLNRRVAGLILVHTTYTNPVRTTRMASLYTLLERPVLVPLLYLTIALWPLVWIMNWLSYWNGSIHRATARDSFAGTETQGQLDFIARFMPRARPDVLARGMLGMLAYDATDALPAIDVPVLMINGDLDATTTPEAGRFIARSVPSGRLETLAPAKHAGLIEHDGRFDALVGQFAEACLGTEALR